MTDRPDDPTVRITISMPLSLLDKLDRIAKSSRRNRSNAIQRWIEAAKETP